VVSFHSQNSSRKQKQRAMIDFEKTADERTNDTKPQFQVAADYRSSAKEIISFSETDTITAEFQKKQRK
jgi:hypothetical protein